MAAGIPARIAEALQAEESGPLDAIIAARRPEDLAALRDVARNEDGAFDGSVQRKALYALGRWGDPALAVDIQEVIPRLNPPARIAAIDALGRLGDADSVDAVTAYADDESPQVRKFVVQALGRIGTGTARDELRRIRATETEEPWLRQLADQAIDALPRSPD